MERAPSKPYLYHHQSSLSVHMNTQLFMQPCGFYPRTLSVLGYFPLNFKIRPTGKNDEEEKKRSIHRVNFFRTIAYLDPTVAHPTYPTMLFLPPVLDDSYILSVHTYLMELKIALCTRAIYLLTKIIAFFQ